MVNAVMCLTDNFLPDTRDTGLLGLLCLVKTFSSTSSVGTSVSENKNAKLGGEIKKILLGRYPNESVPSYIKAGIYFIYKNYFYLIISKNVLLKLNSTCMCPISDVFLKAKNKLVRLNLAKQHQTVLFKKRKYLENLHALCLPLTL